MDTKDNVVSNATGLGCMCVSKIQRYISIVPTINMHHVQGRRHFLNTEGSLHDELAQMKYYEFIFIFFHTRRRYNFKLQYML